MFRVSLHEEHRCIFHAVLHDVGCLKGGRPCWIIKSILLWFNPCPSSRIFFGDSTPSLQQAWIFCWAGSVHICKSVELLLFTCISIEISTEQGKIIQLYDHLT